MTRRVRGADPGAAKARAEAVFQRKQEKLHEGQNATEEYRAKQEAALAKTARLRAAKLARRATMVAAPGVKSTAKWGKAKGRKKK